MNFEPGSRIGDYEIIGILGAGGMGKVFKVRNVISDRVEAMKILLPDLAGEPELADRFMREIKVQASLEHPNIAALHTALRVENRLLMFMEFVEGTTLEECLKAGPLPVDRAVEYIAQVLSALSYAHQRGVIHRDIKPANMMLTPNGSIKLMDFGIAKAAADHRLTVTGTTVGSVYYMSPEQINGGAAVDARSDLYSAGVSLYELVTGKRPFDSESQYSVMAAHMTRAPEPPASLVPGLPPALNDIILLAMAKEPEARFQTADAFRNALRSVVAAPKEFRLIEPTAPKTPRSRRGAWMAAGGICTAAAAIALIQFGPRKRTHAAPAAPPPPAPVAVRTQPAPVPVPETPKPAATAAKPAIPLRAARRMQPAQSPERAQPAPAAQPAAREQAAVAAPQAAPAQPAAPARASNAELQAVREQLVMLSARANGVRGSLQNIQRSQAASGASLRGDMQEAASLMQTFLAGSSDALSAGDAAAAKSFMEKAERQIEILEKFLGR